MSVSSANLGMGLMIGVAGVAIGGMIATEIAFDNNLENNQKLFAQAKKEIVIKSDSVLVGNKYMRKDNVDTIYHVTAADLRNKNAPH